MNEILSDNPDESREHLFYVGNDYETDVIGATAIGLHTVWYNVNHLPNKKNIVIEYIDKFADGLNIAER